MRIRFPQAAIFFLVACTALACTACSSPGASPTTQASATQPTEPPFLFDEARLPSGFPAGGAVDAVTVKRYPPCRLARITKAAILAAGQPETESMFMALLHHIERNDIPMTTPVEACYDMLAQPEAPRSAAEFKKIRPIAMSAIYPDRNLGQPGVDPKDARVSVIDVPACTVLSIGVRGGYSAKNFAAALAKLNTFIGQSGGQYTVIGPPRYLAYNTPFVPEFARFGEVQLPIALADAPTTNPR
jgi:hypothetical protein